MIALIDHMPIENTLIYLLVPLFIFTLSGFLPQSPLGRLINRLSNQYTKRLTSHKIKSPQSIKFPLKYSSWYNLGAVGLLTSLVLIVLLSGKYAFTPLAALVYPDVIVLPNGGHYLVAAIVTTFFIASLTLIGSLLCLVTKEGSYWHYLAARAAHDGQVLLGSRVRKSGTSPHHQQIEDFAGSINIKSLATQNFKRQLIASAVLALAVLPLGLLAIRSVTTVDNQGITKMSLGGASQSFSWSEVTSLTMSIESSAGENSQNIPSLQVTTASGSTLELWGDVFTDMTGALIATCALAREHQVPISVSPAMSSDVQDFNDSTQQKIQSVIAACTTPIIDCSSTAFPALRQLLCP